MSAAFTPGPWEIGSESLAGVIPIMADGDKVVCELDGFGTDVSPDVRLIAAAPDGYAANEDALDTLEKLRADLAEEDVGRHAQRIAVIDLTIETLREALTKARGES